MRRLLIAMAIAASVCSPLEAGSMADKKVRVVLEGQDNLSPKMKQAGKAAGAFESTLGKVAIGITAVNQGLAVAGKAVDALKRGFDLAAEGAQLQRLEQAGHNLARTFGADMDTIIRKVSDAARGTVSEMDIIASANRAMMLGVSANATELAQLMEIAAVRGRAMGLSTTQAFDDIVTGIGRGSKLILDNLGIVIDGEVNLQNVLEENIPLLEAMGGVVDDNASAYERFAAQSENAANRFREAWGEAIAPVVNGLADVLEGHNEIAAAEEYLVSVGMSLDDVFVRAYETGSDYNTVLFEMAHNVERWQDAAGGFDPSLGMQDATLATEAQLDALGALNDEYTRFAEMAEGYALSAAGDSARAAIMPFEEAADLASRLSEGWARGGTPDVSAPSAETVAPYRDAWADALQRVRDVRGEIENLPESVRTQVSVAVRWHLIGGGGGGPGYAYGGQPSYKGFTKVGERGYEYITPAGYVLSHEQSRALDRIATGYQRRGYGGGWGFNPDDGGGGPLIGDFGEWLSGRDDDTKWKRDAGLGGGNKISGGGGKDVVLPQYYASTVASPVVQRQMSAMQQQASITSAQAYQASYQAQEQTALLGAMLDRMEELLGTQDMRDIMAAG